MNEVIHGDSLEYMRTLPDKSIDLVLTAPPYGIGDIWKGGGGHGWGKARKQTDFRNSWDGGIPPREYFDEIFRISKNQIIWGGNYFIEYLGNTRCILVWNKPERNFSLAESEIAWTNFDKVNRTYDGPRSEFGREHPTQKPKELFKWCLENYSKPGDLVLDCFAGSGTTAVACIETGRNYIVIEKEKDYVDIINKRIKNTTPPLFIN